MGALIMAHSDDNGLVLPPKLAPLQVVIIPIYKKVEELDAINSQAEIIRQQLLDIGITVKYDNRDTHKPGWKFTDYELKGVPVRLAIGPRDIENNTVELARRDTLTKETYPVEGIAGKIRNLMEEIQLNIYNRAVAFKNSNTLKAGSYEEFKEIINTRGGFVLAHWDGTKETEEKINNETKATIRCIPLDTEKEPGLCMVTGRPSVQRVIFAKAY
jgi:prolyl-tRNA synthetase